MATKSQAMKAIANIGVELDADMAELGNFTLDAPAGYIFNANNEPSCLVDVYDREDVAFGGVTMPEVWQRVIDTCAMGIREGEGSE